ncbi:hypothetical protein BABINDRAFT_56966 [Babjeviella inositovora NRRL Y-12698]|uniref:3,2-trans-enoyl-CoA isomerase n=1 Tax=Babjeviella inositovora NRRL Y-12698 TaxID=984486 RepID=A0A1E3QZB0_9ASCO|nr:uncharacterized protein BABINDRAFT_56966 [Babjeviella inositovora NRRL Y-12698]ODQ82894.1 hypothetical protein BABINDRAFT_56966 [Babjeviella inositovora NRRL Y-12698]
MSDTPIEQRITYTVKDKVAIIRFNLPDALNALDGDEYLQFAKLISRADNEPDTIATMLTSSGRYFSAGANVTRIGMLSTEDTENIERFWLNQFVSRNTYITYLLSNHKKVLVAALNGPVIGLSAAIVALCDLIYASTEDLFFLAPFANLGLVTEGAVSASLYKRLGFSKANEALLLAKPISGKELYRLGFINKFYLNTKSVEDFNDQVVADLQESISGLYGPSILEIKGLIKDNYLFDYERANSREVIQGFDKWVAGIPQQRFMEVATKQRKHKM